MSPPTNPTESQQRRNVEYSGLCTAFLRQCEDVLAKVEVSAEVAASVGGVALESIRQANAGLKYSIPRRLSQDNQAAGHAVMHRLAATVARDARLAGLSAEDRARVEADLFETLHHALGGTCVYFPTAYRQRELLEARIFQLWREGKTSRQIVLIVGKSLRYVEMCIKAVRTRQQAASKASHPSNEVKK